MCSKHVYALAQLVVPYPHSEEVIEARNIKKVPQAPALHVKLALSGNVRSFSITIAGDQLGFFKAHALMKLSSVLSLHLKR
jgi:hypothetical protein